MKVDFEPVWTSIVARIEIKELRNHLGDWRTAKALSEVSGHSPYWIGSQLSQLLKRGTVIKRSIGDRAEWRNA